MKAKTNTLIGPDLNWAVSVITNPEWTDEDRRWNTYDYEDTGSLEDEAYAPSTEWAQGGSIIEKEGINLTLFKRGEVSDCDVGLWCAAYHREYFGDDAMSSVGPTPLIAAMRCFVAGKLGDEVEVPDELQ